MNPPIRAPAMPNRMVTMKPPGSRPGINSFAITPTTRPNRIHDRIAISVLPLIALRLAVYCKRDTRFRDDELARLNLCAQLSMDAAVGGYGRVATAEVRDTTMRRGTRHCVSIFSSVIAGGGVIHRTVTVDSTVRPAASLAVMRCNPARNGHWSTFSELVFPTAAPFTLHSMVVGLGATTRSGSVWNSRRKVGSIRYVAPAGGLTR